ncbi:MAG: DUF1311 domain-containing protein, partial [Candidatus Aminicenantes bacterium]|nr:DUF1311 domain-containing protein [Candidatus Aminicenantes bacterium]
KKTVLAAAGDRIVDRLHSMRIRIYFLVFLMMALQAADAAVQSSPSPAKHPIDKWLSDCMDKDPSTQGMLRCLEEGYTRWDAELNRVYKELINRLTPEEQGTLREAQKAWLKQRDETFKLLRMIYAKKDGTMYLTMQAADRVEVIQKRALEMASYLDILIME